jgi:hypothetical protein
MQCCPAMYDLSENPLQHWYTSFQFTFYIEITIISFTNSYINSSRGHFPTSNTYSADKENFIPIIMIIKIPDKILNLF